MGESLEKFFTRNLSKSKWVCTFVGTGTDVVILVQLITCTHYKINNFFKNIFNVTCLFIVTHKTIINKTKM